jgi:2-(1,2-epoxy-1,2-dihydrophenyl)acetyl-CoA isomerase
MTSETSPVLLSGIDAAGVVTITFNRPAVFNALDVATAQAFEEAVAALRRTAGLRAVILSGSGKAFIAGGDVGAFAHDLDAAGRTLDRILNHMHPAILQLRNLDAPVIAAVNGVAAGAGLSLVLAADYVIAHAGSRFVLAYDRLAVAPDCAGSWFLSRKVGRAMAFDMMLTGAVFTAEEARQAGIVNRVAADDFEGAVSEAAGRIAAGPTRAFGMFKRLMDGNRSLAEQLELERTLFVAATATDDFQMAVQAFMGKTTPEFGGS